MTKEQVIALSETKWWERATDTEIVCFQLYESLLCMPFGRFHEAVEKVLKRPVYTHEFGLAVDRLKAEFEGKAKPSTLAEIIALLPPEKTIVIVP